MPLDITIILQAPLEVPLVDPRPTLRLQTAIQVTQACLQVLPLLAIPQVLLMEGTRLLPIVDQTVTPQEPTHPILRGTHPLKGWDGRPTASLQAMAPLQLMVPHPQPQGLLQDPLALTIKDMGLMDRGQDTPHQPRQVADRLRLQ